jgi:hypothetical protein
MFTLFSKFLQPGKPGPLGRKRLEFNTRLAAYHVNGDFVVTIVPALLIVLLLGQSPFLLPFRLFTSTLHETSHALVGLLTGAQVGQIVISPTTDSFTQVAIKGNNIQTILVASAGYVGSTFFGGLLLLLSKNPQKQRWTMLGVAAFLFFILALFVHNPSGIFMVMVIIMALAVALKAPAPVVAFSLYLLALLSCSNSIRDLLNLLDASKGKTLGPADPIMGTQTDATILQGFTGVPAVTWATSWSIVSAFILGSFILSSLFLIRKPKLATAATPNHPAPNAAGAGAAYYMPNMPPQSQYSAGANSVVGPATPFAFSITEIKPNSETGRETEHKTDNSFTPKISPDYSTSSSYASTAVPPTSQTTYQSYNNTTAQAVNKPAAKKPPLPRSSEDDEILLQALLDRVDQFDADERKP